MIIDVILDRYDDEARGVHEYSAHEFYIAMLSYGGSGDLISRAMDAGDEEAVKEEIKYYIDRNGYNPDIKNYIDAKTWTEDDVENPDGDSTKKKLTRYATCEVMQGVRLLRDWGGRNYDPVTYDENERKAKRAAAALFRRGGLTFKNGERPRTSGEFISALPYTSTSDFAALWVRPSWDARRAGAEAERLDGFAIDETGRVISVWTFYGQYGDEIATFYREVKEG